MNDMNKKLLYSLIGCTTILFLYYLYKSKSKNKEKDDIVDINRNKFAERLLAQESVVSYRPNRKYIIFLDIDGTLTKLYGNHPQGLFVKYQYYGDYYFNSDMFNISDLFEDNHTLNKIKSLIKILTVDLKDSVELIIATNNYKVAIKSLWKHIFPECPWDNISSRSAFRDSAVNKVELINNVLGSDEVEKSLKNGSLAAIYFEDDLENLNTAFYTSNPDLKIVNCGENWLGTILPTILTSDSTKYFLNCLSKFTKSTKIKKNLSNNYKKI